MTEEFPKIYLYRRIVQGKIYIDQHYANRIRLKDIADEAYFSKYHFIRLFKIIYGKTPHQYLITVRIEKAKLLLKHGANIADVCFSVGFESVSSFIGLFKKLTSITPSNYQKQQVLRTLEITKHPLKYIPNCFAEQYGWTKDRNFQELA